MNGRCMLPVTGLVVAACGGVSHSVRTDLPMPVTVAVLPFAGPAAGELRASARQLVHSRLQARGYAAPELAHVDRVLSERGWLADPDRFDAARIEPAAVIGALGVDAVVFGTDVDLSSLNVVLLRRQAVCGRFALVDAQRRELWQADHAAGSFGGFLLTSGQVFTELRAQGEHGTPMATLALVDELVADVVGTVPERPRQEPSAAPPTLGAVTLARSANADGSDRLVVEVLATAGADCRCDVPPFALGVPMVALPDAPERQRGSLDVARGAVPDTVVVVARDAFGRTARAEGGR